MDDSGVPEGLVATVREGGESSFCHHERWRQLALDMWNVGEEEDGITRKETQGDGPFNHQSIYVAHDRGHFGACLPDRRPALANSYSSTRLLMCLTTNDQHGHINTVHTNCN